MKGNQCCIAVIRQSGKAVVCSYVYVNLKFSAVTEYVYHKVVYLEIFLLSMFSKHPQSLSTTLPLGFSWLLNYNHQCKYRHAITHISKINFV